MNRIAHLSAALGAALLLLGGQAAQASTITFDGHPFDGDTPIFDSGFTFDFVAQGWGVFTGPDACCDVNSDGTPALYADGDRDGPAYVNMRRTGGGDFDVFGLDAASYYHGATGFLNVVGFLSGGGLVSTTLAVDETFSHYSLSGFTGLSSLQFSDSDSGGFLSAPGFGVDNIQLSAAPEPSAWALMLLGFGGLGAAVRNRRRSALTA